jgi:cytochrome P450
MVLAESLRLYPPAWTLHRRVVQEDALPSGLVVRPGAELLLSQYVSHRNSRYFLQPEKFLPKRWTPEFRKSLPVGVYYPFSLGPRVCIGESFARMEALILLTTIGRRFRLALVPGQNIAKEALITLRPRHGLKVELHRRAQPSVGDVAA